MNSMASNGALEEGGGGDGGGTLDTVDIAPDGKPTGERKVRVGAVADDATSAPAWTADKLTFVE